MEIKLYKCSDDISVVSKNLTNEIVLNNTISKHEIDILSPIININTTENLSSYNYMYIERYGRYYYINNIKILNNNLWEIKGTVDVLKTYENGIRKLYGTVTRNENFYNGYLVDSQFTSTNYRQIVTKKFPNSMENDTFILMTVG